MAMIKVLVIGGKCDGQSVYADIRFNRHAVLPEPILTPAQRVVDYSKGDRPYIEKPVEPQYYYLHKLYGGDLAYYLCDASDTREFCGWALFMIHDRVRKFEEQKRAGYHD